MRKRTLGLLAALVLCLGLLPGTALAADGPVTITDNAGNSVALAAGKYYEINTSVGSSGVTERDVKPAGKAYLTYAAGVLTVYGKENESVVNIEIEGKMALSADLKMVFGSNEQDSRRLILSWNGDSGPALALNGHTVTLEKDMSFTIQASEGHKPAVDGGTIRFAEKSNGNQIQLSSSAFDAANAGSAVSGDLAVENVWKVNISGAPPVFQGLDVKKCDQVWIYPYSNNATELSDTINRITIDRPISLSVIGQYDIDTGNSIKIQGLMMPDHTVWTDGGALSSGGTHFISSSVTAPTAYRAGEGWALYTPGDTDTPAKLTLDGASYNGTLNIQQANSVQLELKGENAVKSVNATAMTLTGNGSFQGKLETQAFTNNSTATLNAVVIVSAEEGGVPTIGQTVYGNRSTADLSGGDVIVQENSPLTITNGATLTVPKRSSVAIVDLESLTNNGTIVNQGEIKILSDSLGTTNLGTIVNDGTIVIEVAKGSSGEGIPAFIKALNLTGSGSVVTQYWDSDIQMSVPIATYTNSGVKLFPPAGRDGTLDLSSVNQADESKWENQGYKWTDVEKDESDNITSAKLTLAPGFNAETVILPQSNVEIVTQGESTIGELSVASGTSQTRDLTFSGAGPLKIQEHVEISGAGSSVTVAAGARVEVTGGLTVSDSGAFDGTVTVNGTLTARNDGGVAVLTGKVEVGSSGKLEVYGDIGVQLGGMRVPGSTDKNFQGAFRLAPGGRFTGDCKDYIIFVQEANAVPFEADVKAEDILSIPSGYLPQNLQPEFINNRKALSIPGGGAFNISSDNVPRPPVSGHTHRWAEDWTTSATHHWHACTASGCPVTENSGKDGYGEHVYDGGWDAVCNVCGYTRSLPSEPSGGGSYSGGGGANRPTSPVNVEPSEHGTVTPDRDGAVPGSPVTLTVLPDSGYTLESLTVTDSRGYQLKLSELGGGRYAFTMPSGPATVRAAFAALEEGERNCPSRAFSDLDTGAWYHEAVDYVLSEGLMNGYSNGTFRPNSVLTRAQFAQILYNREGRPAVTGGGGFTDVPSGAWCADAVAWAAERGLVGGYGNGRFGPDNSITREQLAVMLWRYAGSPAASGEELRFTDADRAGGYALEALRWAVETGVMSGRGGGILDPKGPATRAQAAQILKNGGVDVPPRLKFVISAPR